jgi:hypothetical protein
MKSIYIIAKFYNFYLTLSGKVTNKLIASFLLKIAERSEATHRVKKPVNEKIMLIRRIKRTSIF